MNNLVLLPLIMVHLFMQQCIGFAFTTIIGIFTGLYCPFYSFWPLIFGFTIVVGFIKLFTYVQERILEIYDQTDQ